MKPRIKVRHISHFRKLAATTVAAVYLLILVGAIVRTTGSGMGCPDWPKCFGQYVPPTSVEELPTDYQAQYRAKREAKNLKLATMLDRIGFSEQATSLRSANLGDEPATFNAVQTWIEYLNRLVGVLIGLLIMATFGASLTLRRFNPRIPLFSFIALVLVIFQGWLGSIVVSSNLLPGMVTVHMLPALILVGVLIYVLVLAGSVPNADLSSRYLKPALVLTALITLAQIAIGTQVREGVDMLYWANIPRTQWISGLGNEFILHRSFSWLVLAAQLLIFALVKKNQRTDLLPLSLVAIALVVIMALSGIGLAYLGFPAWLQPLHLLIASGLFGLHVFFYLRISRSTSSSFNAYATA